MAPNPSKPSHKSSKPLARKTSSTKSSSTRKPGPKSAGRPPSNKLKPKSTKTTTTPTHQRKRPTYTDKQLSLPSLNMITPAGITKANRTATGRAGGAGTGKRKNKVFVDDRESMMTIMALVNAEKEGRIESKMMRMRRLEEIRDARVAEAEKRKEGKVDQMGRAVEGVKLDLRKKEKGKKGRNRDVVQMQEKDGGEGVRKSGKKRVSFA